MKNKLVGKTIKSAKITGHQEDCDGKNLLILKMTDGSTFYIEGGYGTYTGKSCDEYFDGLEVEKFYEL